MPSTSRSQNAAPPVGVPNDLDAFWVPFTPKSRLCLPSRSQPRSSRYGQIPGALPRAKAAPVAVPRERFRSILQAIGRLRLPVTASG